MLGKLLLALALGLTLVQAPVRAATMACCAEPASHQASLVDGCCAALSCCVISGDMEKQAVTPTPVGHTPAVVPVRSLFVSQIVFPAEQRTSHLARPSLVAHSPPPLAVTGIFLI